MYDRRPKEQRYSYDRRNWTDIGGDLEASNDGGRYVDIRGKGEDKRAVFMSSGTLMNALNLIPPDQRDEVQPWYVG